MLVWCGLVLVDANVAQQAARRSLAVAPPIAPAASSTQITGSSRVLPPQPAPVKGSALAALSIPRIHLSAVVLHGSDARTLRRGPAHLEHTALPGESGNVVIAGHRDSFFRPLRAIQMADDIFLDTPRGRFHYQVASFRVVKASDLSVLAPVDAPVLTLITCYPFSLFGHAPDRFVVRANRIGVNDETLAGSAAWTPSLIDVPVVRPPASNGTWLRTERDSDGNDPGLVRQAIERFRLTYNARLVSHPDSGAGALRFEPCDVTAAGDRATASCRVAAAPSDAGEPHTWTFDLARAGTLWTIRSIGTE
jgi:sortase A